MSDLHEVRHPEISGGVRWARWQRIRRSWLGPIGAPPLGCAGVGGSCVVREATASRYDELLQTGCAEVTVE